MFKDNFLPKIFLAIAFFIFSTALIDSNINLAIAIANPPPSENCEICDGLAECDRAYENQTGATNCTLYLTQCQLLGSSCEGSDPGGDGPGGPEEPE